MEQAFNLVPCYQVCIDVATGYSISGRLYCGLIPDGEGFTDIQQLILRMDEIMDQVAFPQSTVQKRTFRDNRLMLGISKQRLLEMRRFMADKKAGTQATFIVQVDYRHEAEWQGNVKWVEGEEEHEFRSTLELIKYLDKASEQGVDIGDSPLDNKDLTKDIGVIYEGRGEEQSEN